VADLAFVVREARGTGRARRIPIVRLIRGHQEALADPLNDAEWVQPTFRVERVRLLDPG
jgi:hypothetical protein